MRKNKEITVIAHATFLPDQSVPEERRFLWTYEVIIENKSEEAIQLLNRYWRVSDITGHVEEIRGPGVIGLQPVIKPSKNFKYTSFCQLSAPQGTMEGYYEMQNLEESRCIVEIPKFTLACPATAISGYRSKLH